MDQALARAGRSAFEVDYLHTHGTATLKNDSVEASIVAQRFSPNTAVSSTKGATGHTLGAAGVLGAVFSLLAIETGWVAGTVGTTLVDPDMAPFLHLQPSQARVHTAACNAFAFGGSNVVLVFGAGQLVP